MFMNIIYAVVNMTEKETVLRYIEPRALALEAGTPITAPYG